MQYGKLQKSLIIVVAVVFVGLAGFSIVKLANRNDSGEGNSTAYNDPASGQTIVNQSGKTPENGNPGSNQSTEPTFAGLNTLIDKGYSLDEVDATRQAFEKYEPFNKADALISFDVKSLQSGTPESDDPAERFFVTGTVVLRIDDKNTNYKMKLYHTGTGEVQLIIKNADGSQQLFDSGKVTAR